MAPALGVEIAVEVDPEDPGVAEDRRDERQEEESGDKEEPRDRPGAKDDEQHHEEDENDGDGEDVAEVHGAGEVARLPAEEGSAGGTALVHAEKPREDAPPAAPRAETLPDGVEAARRGIRAHGFGSTGRGMAKIDSFVTRV